MNYCCITRRSTNIKWKGNYISRDLLFHAKRIKDANRYTTRQALKNIQNRYAHFVNGKNAKNSKELTLIVKEFLKDLEQNLTVVKVGGYRA